MRNEVGSDINAYRERVVREALRDPTYMRRAQEALRRGSRALPSVNQGHSGGFGVESDDELIEAALRSKTNPWV